VLAEGFVVKSGGDVRVSLGEGERHAVSHTEILAPSFREQKADAIGRLNFSFLGIVNIFALTYMKRRVIVVINIFV
jgi:hypothetical protein